MPETVVRRFANRLHNLRTERGLTQEALAAKARLHPTYISGLERGKQIPSLSTLEQLATGLNVPLTALVDFPEAAPRGRDRVRDELELIAQRLKDEHPDTVRRARKIIDALVS